MRLKEWLKLTNTKQNELAERAGMTRGHCSKVVRGETYPSPALTFRLLVITDGKVTPNDLFEEWKQRRNQK